MAELNTQDVFGGQDFLEKLLEELDTVFPQTLPQPNDSLSSIMFYSGQRSVVEYLIQIKDNNNVSS
tara:strand:- start:55 stop:252 length:198 start_codon:yes stop_codon:yes gene_type:complete